MGHKDLRLGKIVYILVFYNISFSWLLSLDGFQYIFLVRDSRVTVKTIYLLTAISICSRQFQFAHGSFNFAHGNSNLPTAVSICSRQFQFRSRQFQFAHGSFNFAHGSFNFAHGSFNFAHVRLQWISANICHAGCQVLWEIMKYVAKLLITFVT